MFVVRVRCCRVGCFEWRCGVVWCYLLVLVLVLMLVLVLVLVLILACCVHADTDAVTHQVRDAFSHLKHHAVTVGLIVHLRVVSSAIVASTALRV
jgi:hypothetical protein